MGILDDIFTAHLERRLGCIPILPGHWSLNELKVYNHKKVDKKGRDMWLGKGPAVLCPLPDNFENHAVTGEKVLHASVPLKECKKCRFYNGRYKKRSYTILCKYAASDNAEREAVKDTSKSVADAVEWAKQILK